jgi:hypothetical protein
MRLWAVQWPMEHWMPGNYVPTSMVLCLSRLVLPSSSKNVTLSQDPSSQSSGPSPNKQHIFPSCVFSLQVKVTCQARKKNGLAKIRYLPRASLPHYNHTQLWDLRLDSQRFSALVVLETPGEPQTDESKDHEPGVDFDMIWNWWKKIHQYWISMLMKKVHRKLGIPFSYVHPVSVAPVPSPPYPILFRRPELNDFVFFTVRK